MHAIFRQEKVINDMIPESTNKTMEYDTVLINIHVPVFEKKFGQCTGNMLLETVWVQFEITISLLLESCWYNV